MSKSFRCNQYYVPPKVGVSGPAAGPGQSN